MSPKKIKVAFLASCVRGGGAGWSMYYLLKFLDRSRIVPIVIVPDKGIFDQRYSDLDLEVITPPLFPETRTQLRFRANNSFTRALSFAGNAIDNVRLIPTLAHLLNEKSVEVLYCNNMRMHEIGVPAARIADIPCVLHARNLYPGRIRNWVYGRIASSPIVKRVVANSLATAAPYSGVVAEKLTVIHNGVDLAEYLDPQIPSGTLRTGLGLSSDTVIVGYTGRIEPRKGIDVLIRAAAKLLSTHTKAVFVVVGGVPLGERSGLLDDYIALAQTLGISDRVFFTGFVSDVKPALKEFDILCLPSYKEPFGRSLVEAMAMSVPVVSNRAGGVPEIVTDGLDGFLVAPGDADALASALGRLIGDSTLREKMGSAALSTVRKRFDVAVSTEQIEDILLKAAS